MVIWVSTGLAIAFPPGKKNSPADEFIPSELNTEGAGQSRPPFPDLLRPRAGFRGKHGDLTIDASFRAKVHPARIAGERLFQKRQYHDISVLSGITGVAKGGLSLSTVPITPADRL